MPAFAARLVFGQMADDLLLASTRVLPKKLEESGFSFLHPNLDGALHDLLSGKNRTLGPGGARTAEAGK